MEYAWSVNEEDYHGSEDTREAALEAAIGDNDLEPGRKVWTGEVVKRSAGYYLTSAGRLIEGMQDHAYEYHGEYCQDWLVKVTGEQEKELDLALKAAVDAWAEKHGHRPFFYEVINTVEHEITAAAADLPAEPGEIADRCGGCGKAIAETEIAFAFLDSDPVMCAACAPTPEEVEKGRAECKKAYGDNCDNEHCGNHRKCFPAMEGAAQ